MRPLNKKLVVLLVIALCGLSVFTTAMQSGTDSGAKSLVAGSVFAEAGKTETAPGSSSSPGTHELFVKMTLMVLAVLVLGAALIFVSKRIAPRLAQQSGKKIQVVETAHLGHRKTVHLLKVGGKMVLIGCTNENIAMLSEINEPVETDLSVNPMDDNRGIR
jgi:flagellar biogenesis protein FliO